MTLFKDIKVGYPIHVLTRSEDGILSYFQSKVVNVNPPYFPQTSNSMPMPINPGTQPLYNRVMDITLQLKERTQTYTVSENSSMAEAPGGIILATNKDLIIGEAETIGARAREELSKMSIRENEASSSDSVVELLKPEVAEKKEVNKRLSNLEREYSSIKGSLDKILNILNK